jgi:hypothetical protein
MKKLIIIAAVVMPLAFSASAQWIVYDPTMNAQQIRAEAQNLAQYVKMVQNQVQQISQLTAQLNQLEQYNKEFGDPSKILNVTGVSALTADLAQTPLGQTISAVEKSANGVAALSYDASGLYHRIGATFTTPTGKAIQRMTSDYKPFEAINNATANYSNVTANVLQRRQALKTAIAQTTKALQLATTASEVQKLTGVLIGQQTALAATDKEIDQAVAVSMAQDIENRNDREKQTTAAQEEQKAEMVESFDNFRARFQLNTQPPQFPIEQ